MGKQPPLWQGFRTQPFFGPPGLQDGEDGAAVLDGWTYGMGGGAITSITADDGSRWAYEHDANSRLTKAERYDINGTTLLHRYSYTYDDGDNLLTKAVYDAGADSTTSTVFAYGDANLLTSQSVGGTTVSFAYDDWGRMTSKSDGTYSATYAYRYGDKLYSVTSDFPSEGNATYQYDGAGKRRQRTAGGSTTRYRWDLGWTVVNEEDALGDLTLTHVMDSPLTEVASVLADVAGTNPATGAYRYYFSDHLGSTRALYDGSKSALGGYEYTPYGEVYASSGSVALEGLAAAFTGKAWDSAAQMYYFPYRWYSPSAARWLTRDPVGMVDGPNVYAYLIGSPLGYFDALGLARVDEDCPTCKDAIMALVRLCASIVIAIVLDTLLTGITLIRCAAICISTLGWGCFVCLGIAVFLAVVDGIMLECPNKACKMALNDAKAFCGKKEQRAVGAAT